MPNYVALIQRKNTAQLLAMLQSISNGIPIPGWQRGGAFEHIVLRAFEIEGAEVQWPFRVPYNGHTLEQIDGAIYYGGLFCLVESKDYNGRINVEPIAKLRNQLMRRPGGTIGLVFARSGFTEPAKILTRMMNPLSILLWEFDELEEALRTSTMCAALKTKFRFAVEQGMPDFNTVVRLWP